MNTKETPRGAAHVTAPEDRVPTGQKLAYGGGACADNLMQNGINTMANPVFNMTLGVDPGLISTALSLPRLWDAFVDPFVGTSSDNTRGRWGRRKPYILAGSVLCGLFFALVWWVPRGWSDGAYFAHFLAMSLLFFTAYAVFVVPFTALGMEMSPDYHERTRVLAYRTFFGSVSGIGMAWMLWLAQLSIFKDTHDGMRWVGIGTGLVIALLGMLPALFVRERTRVAVAKQRKLPFWGSLREAVAVKPFRTLLYAVVLMAIGLFMVNGLGYYISIYYVYGGDIRASSAVLGWSGTLYHVSNMVSLPLITLASTRFGKRRTLIACLCLPLVGTLSKWFCYHPDYPYLQLVPVLLMGPGMAAFWTLIGSMVADVCDVDELQNGVRREATLGAVHAWAFKVGLSVALLLSGFVLTWSGFHAEAGGAQADGVLTTMRVLFTFFPAVALVITIWLIMRFPITEQSAYDTRRELEKRRGAG